MEPIELTIPAGESAHPGLGEANYIRLAEASAPITFESIENNSKFVMEQGDDWFIDPVIHRIRVYHEEATDQTIKFYAAMNNRGGSSRVSGDIQIVGGSKNDASVPKVQFGVDPQIQGITDPVTVQGITDPVTVQGITDPLTPLAMAAIWGLSPVGTTLQTVVAPASNINGIRIDGVVYIANGTGSSRVMSKTAAPSGWNDAAARSLAGYSGSVSGVFPVALPFPVIIPAGEGLYVQGNANAGDVVISYKVL